MLEPQANLRRRLLDESDHRHAGMHRKSQRQHVGGHAGDAARDRATRCNRRPDDDIVGAGEPMQEDRRGRKHDAGKVCSAASCQCSQCFFACARQIRRHAQDVRRLLRRMRAEREAAGFGAGGERLVPIVSVASELSGRAIGGVLVEQRRERTERAIVRVASGAERRVDLGDAARDQPHAETVEHDVVLARIPEEARGRRLEQCKTEQRPARRIDRPRQVGLHPGFGRGARVALAADVDDRQRPGGVRANHLPRFADLFRKPQTQRVGFGNDLPQRPLEQRQNDRPVDLDILADVVGRARRIELLGKPDAELRTRQRERFAAGRARFVDQLATGLGTQIRHRLNDPVHTNQRAMQQPARTRPGFLNRTDLCGPPAAPPIGPITSRSGSVGPLRTADLR